MRRTRLRSPAFVVALVMLTTGAVALSGVVSALKIQLRKLPIEAPEGLVLRTLPVSVPGWTREGGERPPMTKEMLETLGTENYLSRDYARAPDGEGERRVVMEMHCAYYTGSIDTVPHVPDRCFVGGGMTIVGSPKQIAVPLDMTRFVRDSGLDPAVHKDGPIYIAQTARTSVKPNARVRLPRGVEGLRLRVQEFAAPGGARVFAGYFFIANGGTVASAEGVRLLAFDLRDTYSYYLKVQFTSGAVSSAEELAAHAGEFLDEMLPEIMLRVPDWVEVREGRYPPDGGAQGAPTTNRDSG